MSTVPSSRITVFLPSVGPVTTGTETGSPLTRPSSPVCEATLVPEASIPHSNTIKPTKARATTIMTIFVFSLRSCIMVGSSSCGRVRPLRL